MKGRTISGFLLDIFPHAKPTWVGKTLSFSKNIAPKLDFFTKLKQIFWEDFLDKLKVLPTQVGLACGKMSNKKACYNSKLLVSI